MGLSALVNLKQAQEQAELQDRRQRFFLVAVVAVGSAIRWRTEWKECKWIIAKFAEALDEEEQKKVQEMRMRCHKRLGFTLESWSH